MHDIATCRHTFFIQGKICHPVLRVREVAEQVGEGEGLLVPLLELLPCFLLVGELVLKSLPHSRGVCNQATVPFSET